MIDGMKLDIPGADLKEHLEMRVTHHVGRAALYAKKADEFGDGLTVEEDAKMSSMSNDPRTTLNAKRDHHRERAAHFTLYAKYLVPDEMYRMALTDLREVELILGNRY